MTLTKQLKLRKRSKSSHKGENGRVLVVGGSDSYTGAAYLVGMAAFRTGVDNVTVIAPERVAWVINCLSADFITMKVKGSYFTHATAKKIIAMAKKFDVVAIGNGLGLEKETRKFAAAVAKGVKGMKVIDADAIKAIRLQDVSNSIITPHQREYEILLENSGCSETNVRNVIGSNIIVVKGAMDKIISKKKIAYDHEGHAGMTVGGTGDVMAGIAAGILAQEKDLWKAAVAAACINGRIGKQLSKKYGYGYMASDMLELIGKEVEKLYG
jgi:hydroxyethylthiazole kinase-like uncharacterized protein yjeF